MTRLTLIAILIIITSALHAQPLITDNITSLPPQVKATATEIRLTGTPSDSHNGDFRQLRDLCYNLNTLDLSQAQCSDIPKNAFHSRHILHTIILPKTLKTIGTQAFFACDQMQEITLPDHLEYIGASAFSMCKNIRRLTITDKSRLNEIGSYAFKGCQSLRGTIILPDGLSILGDGAFEGCTKLKKIVLPNGLRVINTNTFSRCTGLTRIDIGQTIESIGSCAFSHCIRLRHITISSPTPPTIDEATFAGIDPGKITLHVPKASIEAYRKAPIWKNFKIQQ